MHVRARLGLMTTASVAIVLVVSGTSFFSVANLIDDQIWLTHSRQVISEFHNLMFRLAAAAGSERGYLLSGSLSHLEDYRAQSKLAAASLKELKEMVKDNQLQIRNLEELSGVVEERMRSFDQTITVYQTLGPQAAYDRVKNGQGTEFLAKVRRVEKTFEGEELRLLEQRTTVMQRSIRAAQLSVVAGALLSIAFVAVFNYFFGRHIVNCIKTLLNASENTEQGRFNIVHLDSDDEFGELADAFNQIGLTLQEQTRQLRESKLDNEKLHAATTKQQESIQLLNGLIDDLAVEFQSYYATLDLSRADLENALESIEDALTTNQRLAAISLDLNAPIESASQKSTSIFRTTTEVRRLLNTTAENLGSLKRSLTECSEQADKLGGLQSELDNISNALEVISMSVDMTASNGEPVLGAVMTRLHELSERCHHQRQFIGESISRMQTLLSRGLLTAHASSGAESTGRTLLDGLSESLETLNSNLGDCRAVSSAMASRVSEQVQLLESCRDAISEMKDNRKQQIEVIERLQESVGQNTDDFIRA